MNKTLLFFGTLCLLLVTTEAYSQRTPVRRGKTAPKTEQPLKLAEPEKTIQVIGQPILVARQTQQVDSKGMKLKVTLLQLESNTTQDSDQIADLGIVQHVRYQANGKVLKPLTKTINKFKNDDKCPPYNGIEWSGSTALICGAIYSQIAVTVSKDVNERRTANINNSVIFNISHQEANDTNAELLFDTSVTEYSRTPITLNYDPKITKVAIHDVLAMLTGLRAINEAQSFFDGGVNKNLKFDNFDGISLPLRNVNKGGKMILEGPIRARNKGPKSEEKAFVWMRFELID